MPPTRTTDAREPETQILRVDIANPARAIVGHILEGYDLYLTADGAVERVSRGIPGDPSGVS